MIEERQKLPAILRMHARFNDEWGRVVEGQTEAMRRAADLLEADAAPEMLEALKAAREHVLWICEHNETVNGGARSEMDRKDLEQIDAAIAKAEGRGDG